MLLSVDKNLWKPSTADARIAQTIRYIENHCEENLSNNFLADKACMATNSFSRLFKNETGLSLQKYVKRKRIDYACMLMSHTSMSIEEITTKTGFSNRFHFTRVFREIMKVTPGRYRDSVIGRYVLGPFLPGLGAWVGRRRGHTHDRAAADAAVPDAAARSLQRRPPRSWRSRPTPRGG